MNSGNHLLILGASARAAAFSALRAGFRPWCADLFADADLQAACPALQLQAGRYPEAFLDYIAAEPTGPWMYTGGLENRPGLVRRLAEHRRLWGNDAPVLRIVRRPQIIARLLAAAGLPCPAVHLRAADVPPHGRWLVKPRRGAGGRGISLWTGVCIGHRPSQLYFQEYVEGDSCAAVYVANADGVRLLGVTRQLVGEMWLHVAPFHYCGSVGPIDLPSTLRSAIEQMGNALVSNDALRPDQSLRGLFGVDFILRDGVPWPVEVNPRYTASVEILEYARGLPALALHASAFDSDASPLFVPPITGAEGVMGKAILFACAPLTFPEQGPWMPVLRQLAGAASATRSWEPPAFADIPHAGQQIEAGRPILTFFARAASEAGCIEALRRIAADLDRRLFGR
jgi:predicted ATP-grasp superfamily ATP-dependent carboligase